MAAKKTTTVKKTVSKKTSPSIISGPNRSEMKKWEIESAMSTLQRAVEIQKNSKLMADVKKMAAEKVKELNNIAAGKMK
jgi:ATP phosphoribosyltransferase